VPAKDGRKAGCGGGERIDENAVGENAAAAETIGQVSAPQAAKATDQWWNPEQVSGPIAVVGRARFEMAEFDERGLEDERADQDDVDVEEKAHGGDGADGPFDGGGDGARPRHKSQG
jgi:hypothetical protein